MVDNGAPLALATELLVVVSLFTYRASRSKSRGHLPTRNPDPLDLAHDLAVTLDGRGDPLFPEKGFDVPLDVAVREERLLSPNQAFQLR